MNALFILSVLATIGGCIVHAQFFDRLPLSDFGLKTVEKALLGEPAEVRESILARGWMTRHQWRVIVARQQVVEGRNK